MRTRRRYYIETAARFWATASTSWRGLGRGDAEGEECSGYLLDDLLHLRVRRVKGRRVAGAAPFDRVRIDLRLLVVDEVAAESVVIRSSSRRIQIHRLLHFVHAPADGLNRALHFVGEVNGSGFVRGGNIFFVLDVASDAALAIVGSILKVHRRVTRLIIVVAPTVEYIFAVAVHIDEVTNVGILIEHPNRVFRFRLRNRAGTDVNLVVARNCRVLYGRRRAIIRP